MDGPHDLGGKEGFGPVDTHDDGKAFHSDWEARAYGISMGARGEAALPIDWFRHCRELIDPLDYLQRPYLDSWLQTVLAQLIDNGDVTLAEVTSGKAAAASGKAPALTRADIEAFTSNAISFERETDRPAAFAVGASVRTARFGHSGHTRLPAYARDRKGVIHAHHGAHLLPDAGARGEHVAEHLYTVAFEASELWPDAQDRKDRIFIDLWESYLDPA